MENILVIKKSKEDKLEELRKQRQKLLIKINPLRKIVLISIFLPFIWILVICRVFKNKKLKKEIQEINKEIIKQGGFESNYQENYR